MQQRRRLGVAPGGAFAWVLLRGGPGLDLAGLGARDQRDPHDRRRRPGGVGAAGGRAERVPLVGLVGDLEAAVDERQDASELAADQDAVARALRGGRKRLEVVEEAALDPLPGVVLVARARALQDQ